MIADVPFPVAVDAVDPFSPVAAASGAQFVAVAALK